MFIHIVIRKSKDSIQFTVYISWFLIYLLCIDITYILKYIFVLTNNLVNYNKKIIQEFFFSGPGVLDGP